MSLRGFDPGFDPLCIQSGGSIPLLCTDFLKTSQASFSKTDRGFDPLCIQSGGSIPLLCIDWWGFDPLCIQRGGIQCGGLIPLLDIPLLDRPRIGYKLNAGFRSPLCVSNLTGFRSPCCNHKLRVPLRVNRTLLQVDCL